MTRRVDLDHTRQGSAPRERSTRIASASNPQIKAIRALRERKERERTGLFYVEGIRAVGAALESGVDVQRLVIAPELLTSDFARGLVGDVQRHGEAVLEVSPSVFESLSGKDGPQGIALVARQRWINLSAAQLNPTAVWVALHQPQDPGNLGSILRTCDAAGAAGLVLIGPSADPYDPSALRASTGAAFTVPLARASWADFTAWLQRSGAHLVGATGDAPTPYRSAAYPAPLVLLMGSEREGLSPHQQAACDTLVHIPMRGTVDSLNLAVATSLVLFEIFNRAPPSS